MKLKIVYSIILTLILLSIVMLYMFFTVESKELSNNSFVTGFLALCIAFIMMPVKPQAYAETNTFRVKYYNFLIK